MNKKRIIVFLIIPCILTACNRNTSEQSIADDEQSISDGNAENMLVVLSEDNFPDAAFRELISVLADEDLDGVLTVEEKEKLTELWDTFYSEAEEGIEENGGVHMRYFVRIMVPLVFSLVSYLWYRLAGKNKREKKKVLEGMYLLAASPTGRYALYSVGVLQFIIMGIGACMSARQGEWKDAVVALSVSTTAMLISFFIGYCQYREHIFFNEEKVIVGRIFRKAREVRWIEIGYAKLCLGGRLLLYDRDGTKCVEAVENMINYDEFCKIVFAKKLL